MNNKVLTIIIVLLILSGGIYYLSTSDNNDISEEPELDTQEQTQDISGANDTTIEFELETEIDSNEDASAPQIRTFDINSTDHRFSIREIRVNEGDTVRINFNNQVGIHDFVLDEFNVQTAILNPGQSEQIEFVANQSGTFEYYCSVGNHRQLGMVGTLIVESN